MSSTSKVGRSACQLRIPLHNKACADTTDPEQEELISELRKTEVRNNARYMLAFSILPLVVASVFLVYLRSPSRRDGLRCLTALTAVTSLILSSLTMYYLTPAPGSSGELRNPRVIPSGGPVHTFLPKLNGTLAFLLVLASFAERRKLDSPEGLWVLLMFPMIIYGLVIYARWAMAAVEEGLKELDRMKYSYKGA